MESGEPDRSVLTLVANVRSHRFHGESGEIRAGTKHFSGGTKVTFKSSYGGGGHVEVTVIGRHRKSKKLITIDLQRRYLENWRVQAVYSPAVLSRLIDPYHKGRTADDLQQTAEGFNRSRFFYAFERPMDRVRSTIENLWGDDVPAGLQQLIGAPHLGHAVAYQDGPDRPIGVGILNEHRYASTFFGPGFVDRVGRGSAAGALRTRLGIVNQRRGDELGLRHLRVHWKHDHDDEPIHILSEVSPDMVELRKVEVYRDRVYRLAAVDLKTGTTRLSTVPVPPLSAINEDPQFIARETNAQHFESYWVAAHNQADNAADSGQ